MKRNLNKAFTLIELLAVIVILAIIALIATPIILGIVEDARKDSFERSVELVISTTDLDVASKNIQDGYTYEITDGTIPELEIGIKNIEGMNGIIVYDKEGKEQYAIHNGQYCVMKTEGMDKAVISDYEEGSCKLSIVTSSKYFTYKEIEIEPTYEIIDKEACQTVFVGKGTSNEDATTICNNEPFEGMTLTEALANGLLGPDTKILLDAGAISYTGPEYEIIDKEACQTVIVEFGGTSEEAITACNNEPHEEFGGLPLTEFFQYTSVEIEFIEQLKANLLDAGAIRVNVPLEITGYSEEGPKNVVIPSTIDGKKVVSIGRAAFYNKNLTSVSIPETVTSIGNYAFGYNNLTQANKNEIAQINSSAVLDGMDASCFTYEEVSGGVSITGYKCADTDVIIPSTINNKSVVKIGQNAFNTYQYQSEVSYLKKPIVRPVNYEFAETAIQGILTSVIIPDTVTYIDDYAFYYNRITNVYLSKNLEYIGEAAFDDNQITTLSIPDSVTYIGAGAFSSNVITDIKLSSNLEYIDNGAFSNNPITTIILSNNNHLETVGDGAFCGYIDETSEAYQTIYQLNNYAFNCGK